MHSDGPPVILSYLTLLQAGFAWPTRSPGSPVGSYSTLSPLPVIPFRIHRRSSLCCAFLRVASTGCYPALRPVESRLSSMPRGTATAQPTHCGLRIVCPPRPGRWGGDTAGRSGRLGPWMGHPLICRQWRTERQSKGSSEGTESTTRRLLRR